MKTDFQDTSRVRHVSLDAPGLRSLRAAGLVALGMDHRVPKETWGEGVEPTHLLFLMVSGGVDYIGQGPPQPLHAGDLLVVPSCSAKRFVTGPAPAQAAWFHFVESRCPVANPAAGARRLRCDETPLLHACLESLIQRSVHPAVDAMQTTQAAAALLLRLLQDAIRDTPGEDDAFARQLARLWDEVNARLDAPWTVAELARRCGLCPGHFHRRCRELTGAGPMATVRRLRMERAAFLLDTTRAPLDAIATQVGYTSPYSFSQAFTREQGRRPGAYRQRAEG